MTNLHFSDLLRRYISCVQACEGTDFVRDFLEECTPEEAAWMTRVADEEWGKQTLSK